ncbi:inositol-pentakisphosphate 2-kinase-domain-containing protein [Boeremia exigua]|uniref:inositol-pentakisphosphate 2-kinase-domain-containing protein n=1 Tax=Boeremia exigua TaxID=749465 RepID=UPI001E8D58E0|nr:inositol-pentakisphosphate 2-kinase-domain-containing protein [Boeremia exigua]KAH6643702.1 inositol-pentakisphosphate 2-kinase-domain-containing protein [Boeremia exigua]
MSDLDVLHTRLSNAHLLAHHQFELHPTGGVSYRPHPTKSTRHGRQPSHSLLPHIQSSPDAKGPGLVELTKKEIDSFQSLDVPSALCCIQREESGLSPFFVQFKSLNEGAANAVFSIQADHGVGKTSGFLFVAVRNSGNTATTIPSHMILDKVLRVSKGLPKSLKSEVIVDGFMADVRPLFVAPKTSTATSRTLEEIDLDKHLMAHLPVVLFSEGMSALKKLVPAIHPLNNTAQFGILLPNMSTAPGQNITFEIKPKWLAQSPTAPPNAIRCRTCALQFSRGKGTPDDYICPLRLSNEGVLGNSDVAHIRRWAVNALSLQLKNDADTQLPREVKLETLVDRVVAYFINGDGRTLLLHLKKLQATLDSEGILQRYAHSRDDVNFVYDIRLAMTLRDCSLFVVVPLSGGEITSKLADLDFKSAEKIDDWREKEATLVDEGWYVKSPEAHDVCLLATGKSS